MDLELSLKKEGKMLREIGFKVCGHRICMIKAPNVCGICGRKYKTEKALAKKSKYVECGSDSDSESDKESDEEVGPVSKNKLVAKKSLLKKPAAKKSKYVQSDSDSESEYKEESDKEVAPVSNRAASKRKPVSKKSLSKNMVVLVVEFSIF